jgi:hypothetical protein
MQAAGISEGLIRLSVGIEATQDLVVDFSQALERLGTGASGIANHAAHNLTELSLT